MLKQFFLSVPPFSREHINLGNYLWIALFILGTPHSDFVFLGVIVFRFIYCCHPHPSIFSFVFFFFLTSFFCYTPWLRRLSLFFISFLSPFVRAQFFLTLFSFFFLFDSPSLSLLPLVNLLPSHLESSYLISLVPMFYCSYLYFIFSYLFLTPFCYVSSIPCL